MTFGRDEILDAALKLPEPDRILIATRLMDTLPDNMPGLSLDDPGLLDELERRFRDTEGAVPVSELWKQD